MNQTAQVYEYMQTHGSIDPFRAFTELGILRLGARIWDLRDAGVEIESEMKYSRDENGKIVKKWKEYRLCKNLPRYGEVSENPWEEIEKMWEVDGRC